MNQAIGNLSDVKRQEKKHRENNKATNTFSRGAPAPGMEHILMTWESKVRFVPRVTFEIAPSRLACRGKVVGMSISASRHYVQPVQELCIEELGLLAYQIKRLLSMKDCAEVSFQLSKGGGWKVLQADVVTLNASRRDRPIKQPSAMPSAT
jgi:hypothetical protein